RRLVAVLLGVVDVRGDHVHVVVGLGEDRVSHAAKVSICAFQEPQAISSRSGSPIRIARAVSVASRAYASAFLWPICQGPSISLPRHHMRMSCFSAEPVLATR